MIHQRAQKLAENANTSKNCTIILKFSNLYLLLFTLLFLSACSTTERVNKLDNDIDNYMDRAQTQGLPAQSREDFRLDQYETPTPEMFDQPLQLDLRQTLLLAAKHNRDYQTSREALYSTAIALWVEAYDWQWNPSNTLRTVFFHDFEDSNSIISSDAQIGLSRRLLSGARFSMSLGFSVLRYLSGDSDTDLSTIAAINLTQPLLAGAGPLVAREALTQAERDLVYAVRIYVRNKKTLVLRVAERYYAVLSAIDSVEIAQRNYENLRNSRIRSERMAEAGEVAPYQVDQARQDELTAHATLISRKQIFESRQDDLKLVMGIPLTIDLEMDRSGLAELAAAQLPPPPVEYDRAVEMALERRFDFANVRGRVEDAQRKMFIARDRMRTRLNLDFATQAKSRTDNNFRLPEIDDLQATIELEANLPFDRRSETAAFRRSLLLLAQNQREVIKQRDFILAELRADWRDLIAAEDNYEIQKVSVRLAEQRVESTEMLFQAGRVEMRDILDARNALIRAENALTRALVTHRLAWLRILLDIEAMPTDPQTLWSPALRVPAEE